VAAFRALLGGAAAARASWRSRAGPWRWVRKPASALGCTLVWGLGWALAMAASAGADTGRGAVHPPGAAPRISEKVEPGHCPPQVQPPAGVDTAPGVDRGMLWQLQRDGRTSWLYGTLHVGRPGWQRPGPRVQAALQASDTLAVELDLDDPQLAAQMGTQMARRLQQETTRPAAGTAAHPAADPGEGAAGALPPALARRLQAARARGCLEPAQTGWMPPLMQVAALTLHDGRWLGLDGAYGQERALGALARQRGMRVVSLETLEQQLTALQPTGPPAEQQRQLGAALQQLEDGSARLGLMRLAQAWSRGDLQALERYEDWCECAPTDDDRRLLRQLNDARNPGLADGIAAQHARGRRVFAAVGALHMTGAQALPRLLAERGFRVRRMPLALGAGGAAEPGAERTMPAAAGR
jgi:uncharacterized protein YbaP (TraB family)